MQILSDRDLIKFHLTALMLEEALPADGGLGCDAALRTLDRLTQPDNNPEQLRDDLLHIGLVAVALLHGRLQERMAAEREAALLRQQGGRLC